MRVGWSGVSALLIVLVAACGSDASPVGPDDASTGGGDGPSFGDDGGAGGGDTGPGGKACTTNADCGPNGVCDPGTHTCGCGGVAVAATDVPPNLLVVEDRSCSMTDKVGAKTKWEIAVGALKTVTTLYKGKIRFGLTLFPDRAGTDCTQAAIPIPVAPGNETKIQTLLTSALVTGDPNFPNGPCVTNIDTALTQAETEPAFLDGTRRSFALLITDGMQSGCNAAGGDTGTVQAITRLAAKGVNTFVVGFGSAVSVTSLDSFAQAGGMVNVAGPHKFYDASDQVSLDAALNLIAKATLGCDLQLASPPPNGDPSLVFVYFNKTAPPIPRDTTHTNGWDYDAVKNQIRFYGKACADLKSGTVTDVSVVFGCQGGPAPPPPR